MISIKSFIKTALLVSGLALFLYAITAYQKQWFPGADLYLLGLAFGGAATFLGSFFQTANIVERMAEHSSQETAQPQLMLNDRETPNVVSSSQRIQAARNWGAWGVTLGFVFGVTLGTFFGARRLSVGASDSNKLALFILTLLTFVTVASTFSGFASTVISVIVPKIGKGFGRILVGSSVGTSIAIATWLLNETTSSTILAPAVPAITIGALLGAITAFLLSVLGLTCTGLLGLIFVLWVTDSGAENY